MVPSSEGDRTVDCSTYVRTDLIMHRVLTRQSPLRMRIEASVRALVVAVLRGRSAATSALDNLGLLIEGGGEICRTTISTGTTVSGQTAHTRQRSSSAGHWRTMK